MVVSIIDFVSIFMFNYLKYVATLLQRLVVKSVKDRAIARSNLANSQCHKQ